MSARFRVIWMITVSILLTSACQQTEPVETALPPTATETSTQTSTPLPPTPTQTAIPPTFTPSPTILALPTTPSTLQEITFESCDFTLVGDLQLPGPDGRYPVIIMVHGSGNSDRDDWGKYRPIMRRFLGVGYAVFSWDKPGVGESTGELAGDAQVLGQRAAILVQAIEVIKAHPAIDPERIGLWGISQAGYVMPLALTVTGDVAFMIVNSGPAMDSYDQGAYLTGQRAYCAGASQAEARQIEQYMSAVQKAATYPDYAENMAALQGFPILAELDIAQEITPEDAWAPEDPDQLAFFNPIDIIRQTSIPVLAFFGDLDRQVDPLQGTEAFQEALTSAGNPLSHVELISGTDHNLVVCETGCLDERAARSGTGWLRYASIYLNLMEEWLAQLTDAAGG